MESKSNTEVRALKAHLALNVRNVSESIEFYKKMLGIEPSKVRAGYAKFDAQNPPFNLTLNQAAFRERGALSHLGIQVSSTDEVVAMRQKWVNAGLVTRDEMQTNCCYAIQDKTWTQDPDGNEWEVFVVLQDHLPETSRCSVTAGDWQESATDIAREVSCCVTTAIEVEPSLRSTLGETGHERDRNGHF
jgi:catechol 2,3-dioxygenase-like lactoylglutathione lyase family enzyme